MLEKLFGLLKIKKMNDDILAKSVLAQGFSELKSSFDSLMKNLASIAPTTFWGVIRNGHSYCD